MTKLTINTVKQEAGKNICNYHHKKGLYFPFDRVPSYDSEKYQQPIRKRNKRGDR